MEAEEGVLAVVEVEAAIVVAEVVVEAEAALVVVVVEVVVEVEAAIVVAEVGWPGPRCPWLVLQCRCPGPQCRRIARQ